jgi:hypothetical protein
VVALAGCGTSMRWERPGTDQATSEADIRECRAIARAQHRHLTERPFLVPYFVQVRDKKGRRRTVPVVPWQQFGPPVWYPYAPWLATDRLTLKHELYERCLEAKGYRLVPYKPVDDKAADTAPSGDAGGSGDAGSPGQAEPSGQLEDEPPVAQPAEPEGQAPADAAPAR